MPPPDPIHYADFAVPDDPAGKRPSSGLVELLPQEEIKIYSDVDGDELAAERGRLAMNDDSYRLFQFGYKFTRSNAPQPDFTRAQQADLQHYLELLAASKASTLAYSDACKQLHGAENAIVHGKTTLASVQNAEGDPW